MAARFSVIRGIIPAVEVGCLRIKTSAHPCFHSYPDDPRSLLDKCKNSVDASVQPTRTRSVDIQLQLVVTVLKVDVWLSLPERTGNAHALLLFWGGGKNRREREAPCILQRKKMKKTRIMSARLATSAE